MNNTVEAIKHLFLDAGAGWVMWLLIGLSVASFAVALERWLLYRRSAGDLHHLAEGLHAKLLNDTNSEDRFSSAVKWLESSNAVAAQVAAAGLKLAPHGIKSVKHAIESRTALERER